MSVPKIPTATETTTSFGKGEKGDSGSVCNSNYGRGTRIAKRSKFWATVLLKEKDRLRLANSYISNTANT